MTNSVYLTLEDTAKFYQEELKKIYEFLAPLEGIWSTEVLNQFPDTLSAYSQDWLDAMDKLDFEKEWQIELGKIPKDLQSSQLIKLFDRLHILEDLPHWNFDPIPYQTTDYPSWALSYVSLKKQHEIMQLSSLLEQTLGDKESKNIVDIGGGKGHLGRILALYHGHQVTTLDTNLTLQKLGIERLKKYPYPEEAGELEFLNHTFGPQSPSPAIDEQLFKNSQVTLGLHTCGPLSLEHLNTYENHQSLYNFGCCYQKLDSDHEINLSQFSKKDAPLKIGKYALTLATRGHTKINQKDYQLKKRVKLYRAALHLWMKENTKENTFITVGSAKPRDYFGSFGQYAAAKLEKFNLYETREKLDQFYEQSDIQEKLKTIFHANLIRWRFGRIIEKYILMDRALWQVEQGNHAQLYQVFSSELSPRNTVLYIPQKK